MLPSHLVAIELTKKMTERAMPVLENITLQAPNYVQVTSAQGNHFKGQTLTGLGQMVEHDPGVPPAEDELYLGYATSAKTRDFGKRVKLHENVVMDANTGALNLGSQDVQQLLTESEIYAQSYIETIDQRTADYFNYGAYTAGHSIFNNNLAGHISDSSDLNYDGVPLFAPESNGHPLKEFPSIKKWNSAGAITLSATNLDAYLVHAVNNARYDDRNNKKSIAYDLLMTGPGSVSNVAKRITNDMQQWFSANTDRPVNVFRHFENPYLSGEAWVLISSMRKGLEVKIVEMPNFKVHYDEFTRMFHIFYYARAAWHIHDWRPYFGANLPTS